MSSSQPKRLSSTPRKRHRPIEFEIPAGFGSAHESLGSAWRERRVRRVHVRGRVSHRRRVRLSCNCEHSCDCDSRGRHTTTTRELFVLPGGALLMDTPGLREMQLWDADSGVAQVFGDIDLLAAKCRFGDCRHEAEPGCAVRAALSTGRLDPSRVENRRKLLREQEFLRRKMDPQARQEEKQRIKEVHRQQRWRYRHDKFAG